MEEMSWEKRFHFRDGTAARDIGELRAKIESISYDEFYRHVNGEKNDFANWIEHVLRNKELADRLRAVDSIVETVEIIEDAEKPAQKRGEDDLQARIERQIFEPERTETLEPVQQVEEEVPELEIEVETPSEEIEPKLPSSVETEFEGRVPGAPVATAEPPHVPIKELAERHAEKNNEEQMRFFVRQFIYGFLFGLFVGFILSRIIGL